jgi:chromosome segregation ATPase
MTMQDPSEISAGQDTLNWLQDQINQLRGHVGRLNQQNDQMAAAMLDVNEKLRDAEGKLREMTARTIGLPVMQDQMRHVAGLLERIQDAEVLIDTKFEQMERQHGEERDRDQSEKNDLYKRVQDLERRAEGLGERQASVDEYARRFQDEISRSHVQTQGITQRLDAVESKAARSAEAILRIEQAHGELESAIRTLRREDDVIAERARLAQEVAGRLEHDLRAMQEEVRGLPLLAERVELMRTERQRLEDRSSRIEEYLEDARARLEREEEATAQLDKRILLHETRLEHVHNSALEFRRTLSEQLLKLNQSLERMRRRHVEELEREIKELHTQANALKAVEE